jgi:hypothetical protein
VAVKVVELPEQIDVPGAVGATGVALTVTSNVAIASVHPLPAAIVLVIVYVPAALAARSISPVLVLTKTNPAGALKTPALDPAGKVGKGLIPCWQYGPA